MSNGGIRISGIIGYLDIWRGALYSVLLGVVYRGLLGENLTLSVHSWVFFIGITVFLLVDGVTRFNSRQVVRQVGSISVSSEFIWLALEMLGLFFFVCWAYQSVSLKYIALGQFGIFIGFFSICAAIHNAFLIEADEGVNFWEFLKIAVLGDASEIKSGQVSERWQVYFMDLKSDYIKILKSKKKEIDEQLEKQKLKSLISPKILFQIFNHFMLGLKVATTLGLIHGIIQLTALHLFVLNLIAAIAIIFSPNTGLIPLPLTTGAVTILFIFISIIAYSVTSYKEMERHDDHDNSQLVTMVEKVSQAIGNLLLVICIVVLYLALPKNWLILAILAQQMIIGISLLRQAGKLNHKTSNLHPRS